MSNGQCEPSRTWSAPAVATSARRTCGSRAREPPALPALTRAEGELIDRHLEVVDLLGRINPARGHDTYSGLRAAQALVTKAVALR